MARTKKETAPERTAPQSFHEWLSRHARGTLDSEATIGLAEVVQSVTDIGKAGKLVIEVVVEPAGSGGRTVAIGGKVLKKLPLPSPELGVFYVGDGGSLHRDDPYQQRIPGVAPVTAEELGEVRHVATGAEEVRTVEDAPPPQRVEEGEDR